MLYPSILGTALLAASLARAVVVISDPNNPPAQAAAAENGQTGYNDCANHQDSPASQCQTVYLNSLEDFCLFAPPDVQAVGDAEAHVVSWCSSSGHGARLIPSGTISGAHWVVTPDYVQLTGVGDLTKLNIPAGDEGGELDPHGATNEGNPIGGLVLGSSSGQMVQYEQWTQFISDHIFCIRACNNGPNARRYCEHIYDEEGCKWNMPANYDSAVYESCDGDTVASPMGEYVQPDGTTSTFSQGQQPTPAPGPAPASSNCATVATVAGAPYADAQPTQTPTPTPAPSPAPAAAPAPAPAPEDTPAPAPPVNDDDNADAQPDDAPAPAPAPAAAAPPAAVPSPARLAQAQKPKPTRVPGFAHNGAPGILQVFR